MADLELLLYLNRLSFLTSRERIFLATKFESAATLRRATLYDLSLMVNRSLAPKRRPSIQFEFDLRRDLRVLHSGELEVVSFFDPLYPPLLRQSWDPPLVLFCRGNRQLLADDAPVSVVGTRRPDGGALKATRILGAEIARDGYTVVSGLARGIDGAAHRGALGHPGGRTVAVLGSGVDRLYPDCHRPLGREILSRGGLLVSEFPPGTEARKYRFPKRNRIIAGMSPLLWVIQAPEGSGALITAGHASSENRDIVCHRAGFLPGRAGQGCRALEEEGCGVYGSWSEYRAAQQWPPYRPGLEFPDSIIKDWEIGVREKPEEEKDSEKARRRRRQRRAVKRETGEVFSGQQLLSIFTGEEEDLSG